MTRISVGFELIIDTTHNDEGCKNFVEMLLIGE
jgi:hypothetical protein